MIFLVAAYRFGVPFPKLKIFSVISWTLHVDYSQYEKTILGILVHLFFHEVTITKANLFFKNSAVKPHVLFENESFFSQVDSIKLKWNL